MLSHFGNALKIFGAEIVISKGTKTTGRCLELFKERAPLRYLRTDVMFPDFCFVLLFYAF